MTYRDWFKEAEKAEIERRAKMNAIRKALEEAISQGKSVGPLVKRRGNTIKYA